MLGSHAKGYAAVGSALKRFQIFVDLAQLRPNDPRSCEKRLASAGRGGTAGISLQKLDVKLLLKLTDTFANRRLRDADFSRRGAQAARFDDGEKVSDLAEPHGYNRGLSKCIGKHLTPRTGPWFTAMMRGLLIAFLAAALPVGAQVDYPSRPIRAITGAPPGSPGDVAARIVSEPLGAMLGQPVVLDHRIGAMNAIALGALVKSNADGYTLGVMTMPWTVTPHLLAKASHDLLRDLAPVRQLAWVSNVLVVRATAPFASARDLIAAAKVRPYELTFASGGNSTPAHLSGELLRLSAGIDMRHVPFKGAIAGVTAVMGEQVDMMFAIAPAVLPHIRAGRLRALATPAPSRLPALPEVPTLVELGYAVEVRDWTGIVVPAGTPKPVIARIDSALGSVLAQNEVKQRLAAAGFEPAESGPDAFGALIRDELQKWKRVVAAAGIKPD
jgi:tripartite-type tricarboxylate transporter receptor subunit TctC